MNVLIIINKTKPFLFNNQKKLAGHRFQLMYLRKKYTVQLYNHKRALIIHDQLDK